MTGGIESGQLRTVVPIEPAMFGVGDIVLCEVAGNDYLHIIKAIRDRRYQIGNNRRLSPGSSELQRIIATAPRRRPF